MEHPDGIVRQQFIEAAGLWVERLCGGERFAPRSPARGSEKDGAGPRQIVNLAHRLSDTLPGDLANRLEEFADEFWTLCQRRWPNGDDSVRSRAQLNGARAIGPDELAGRLDRLARAWKGLEQDLAGS